jgi:hypothetical protein
MVNAASAPAAAARRTRTADRRAPARLVAARVAAALLLVAGLAAGLAGGLRRAGIDLPVVHAVGAHAALMIGGFFAAVIGVERAVALRTRWAWAAPAASASGALALAFGADGAGSGLLAAGATVFVLASLEVLRRQRAAHTATLLLAALCGLGGALSWWAGIGGELAVASWLAFLVLTIAAERLEMTRLMRRRAGAQPAFFAIVASLLAALALLAVAPGAGAVLYGLALLALAIWLGLFDIARITLGTQGLPRYMAVALLAGYAWLGLGGVAWILTAAGLPVRDAAMHALGLGFVFSMVMAHAPVILPAVAGVKLHFDGLFYGPLALLHGSLLLRLALGWMDPRVLAAGALFNVAALVVFMLTIARAAWAWRHLHHTKPQTP